MNRIGISTANLTARRNLSELGTFQTSILKRLSTGQRINSASDDPAGLIASENLRSLLSTIDAESRSLQRSSAVASTADAALGTVSDLLVEAEGLAVANANTTGVSDAEREANQMQLDSILATVDRIAGGTAFNGDPLLDGSATLRAGGDELTINSIQTTSLGPVTIDGTSRTLSDTATGGAISILDDPEGAQQSIRAARSQVSTQRGALGSFQRDAVGSRMAGLATVFENVAAAQSIIRDTDFALETAQLNRIDILLTSTAATFSLVNRGTKNLIDLLA